MDQNLPDFTIEFESEVPHFDESLKQEVENRLQKLARGHTDMVGAAVSVKQPAKTETGFIYRARIVAYVRPENIAAVEKDDTVEGALKGALKALEKQIRKKREKLGEPWKRDDIPSTRSSSG